MGKLCERPGCSDVAAMAYGFDVDRLLVWLAPRDPDGGDPMRAGSLCKRHADAMVVPRGWTLDDRRESTPRLFRTPPPPDEESQPANARGRARRSPTEPSAASQLELAGVPTGEAVDASRASDPAAPGPEVPTVAAVTGSSLADEDPDATVAIPWLPTFNDGDDLDGVLAARSPLLARAFRGDRPTALMQTSVELFIPDATADDLFEQVATLDRYPGWMRLVHRVEEVEPDEGRPAWRVQLRARVGPFARSKQLRMVRTVFEPGRRARFERIQRDDREHADWTLTATVAGAEGGATVVTDLVYGGTLWGSALLERVLDDEIRRGKVALGDLVSAETTR